MAFALAQPVRLATALRPLARMAQHLKTLGRADPVPYWTDYLNARD